MNGQYNIRSLNRVPIVDSKPFNLLPYSGPDTLIGTSKNWMVNNGICYSTFSYDSGSYVPITNLNKPLEIKKDYAVYLDFTILGNMQVSGASVKSSKVGQWSSDAATDNPNTWIDYPDFYRIRPFDQTENGKVINLVDGKKQQKCYLMIGKCFDNPTNFLNKGPNYNYIQMTDSDKKTFYYVQYVQTDLILMGSNVSGVPVVFPMPYFGGPSTSDAAQLIFKK
jgi:hypothetical protein